MFERKYKKDFVDSSGRRIREWVLKENASQFVVNKLTRCWYGSYKASNRPTVWFNFSWDNYRAFGGTLKLWFINDGRTYYKTIENYKNSSEQSIKTQCTLFTTDALKLKTMEQLYREVLR